MPTISWNLELNRRIKTYRSNNTTSAYGSAYDSYPSAPLNIGPRVTTITCQDLINKISEPYLTVLMTSGFPNNLPRQKIKEISPFMEANNQKYVPIVLTPQKIMNILINIEKDFDMCLIGLEAMIKENNITYKLDLDMFTAWDEWSGPSRLMIKAQKISQIMRSYITKFSDITTDNIRNITNYIKFLRNVKNGYLMKTYYSGYDTKKETDYFFVMAPFYWCFECELPILDNDNRSTHPIYSYPVCKLCDQPIYHLPDAKYISALWLKDHKLKTRNIPILINEIPDQKINISPDIYSYDDDECHWVLDFSRYFDFCTQKYLLFKKESNTNSEVVNKWSVFQNEFDIKKNLEEIFEKAFENPLNHPVKSNDFSNDDFSKVPPGFEDQSSEDKIYPNTSVSESSGNNNMTSTVSENGDGGTKSDDDEEEGTFVPPV